MMVGRRAPVSRAALLVPLLALAACGPSPSGRNAGEAPEAVATANKAAPASRPAAASPEAPAPAPATHAAQSPATLVSCATEIGAAAAQRKVKACLTVSPATHPPCNAANSCAMIDDEIARSCALFDGQGAPMPECTVAPKSAAAAVAVVRRYYAALNAHDYGTAWQQWGDDGPPNQPLAKFQAGFAHTRATRVTIGALPSGEGAAGSIYQTVPVTVDATLDDGAHQRFAGHYVIRRVNDVDGASADQLRWHIDSAHLAAAK
jgi:hypothetical protein